MIRKLGAADGEEVAQKPRPKATYLPPTGSPRNPVPEAICAVITTLLEEWPDPSYARVELRGIRSRLMRLYKLPQIANVSDVAWEDQPDEEIPE